MSVQLVASREPVTVLAHGVFDILHLGHIRHLQEAKRLGDKLVVSITADHHVRKGMGRPYFTVAQRVEALAALECVDEVTISDDGTAIGVIDAIKPDIYVKGIDYSNLEGIGLDKEIAAVEKHGGRFHVTMTEKWSSSALVNVARFPHATVEYLASARASGFRDKIHAAFERADRLRVAFVGETIVDEYRYVGSLGKPSKEYVLATVEVDPPDLFLGGAHAAHLQGEWQNVELVTNDGSPLKKTRFVDADFKRKLFEVYSRRTVPIEREARDLFRARLSAAVLGSDCVVLIDFGHALMGATEREIVQTAKFLAVNSQCNAGNSGFNPVGRYKHANYACIDEPEARFAAGMQFDPIEEVMASLHELMPVASIAITRGSHGCLYANAADDNNVGVLPPFSLSALDTMGAGDAFLAVSAPLIAAGLELEPAAFAGNVAGALKVAILGHADHVKREDLLQTVDALLA